MRLTLEVEAEMKKVRTCLHGRVVANQPRDGRAYFSLSAFTDDWGHTHTQAVIDDSLWDLPTPILLRVNWYLDVRVSSLSVYTMRNCNCEWASDRQTDRHLASVDSECGEVTWSADCLYVSLTFYGCFCHAMQPRRISIPTPTIVMDNVRLAEIESKGKLNMWICDTFFLAQHTRKLDR